MRATRRCSGKRLEGIRASLTLLVLWRFCAPALRPAAALRQPTKTSEVLTGSENGTFWESPTMEDEFTAIIEQDGEWHIAECLEIPGANGQRKNKDEARENLAEAIALILEDRREEGLRGVPPEAIPETVTVPSSGAVCSDTFGCAVVISNAKEVLIRCGAIPIRAEPRRFQAMLQYPTVWRARSVVRLRFQRSGKNNPGLASGRNRPESALRLPVNKREPALNRNA